MTRANRPQGFNAKSLVLIFIAVVCLISASASSDNIASTTPATVTATLA